MAHQLSLNLDMFNRSAASSLLHFVLVSLGLIVGGCHLIAGQDAEPPPNIVLIVADDLGYGDLGSYGQVHTQTPNLDRMAEEGMRFTQYYAGSTVCAPSRSVLMTGLHTGHTPVRGNKEIMPTGQYPLPYGTPTMAEVLKQAGYRTGAFGKWGLGYPGSEGTPSHQGFDTFFGYLGQRRAHFYYPEFLFRDERGKALEPVPLEGNRVEDTSREGFQHPGSGPPISRRQYSPNVITGEALSFIEQNSREPFFLYSPTPIPHASLTVPEEALEPYLDENGESVFTETPFPGGHYTAQPMPKATYAAMITLLDDHVGRILDKLEELGIAENTLVLFSSDNGSHTAGGYHYTMHNSNGPFRGGKRDLYEGGIRVPMIAWWPGTVSAGSVSDHMSGFQDLMPTFAKLAGVPVPSSVDGVSMVPTLTGRGAQQQNAYLYWEFHEQGGKQAVRRGSWKAVRLNVNRNPDAPVELYHLEEDAGEEQDIADRHPGVVEELSQIMEEARVPSEVFPFKAR